MNKYSDDRLSVWKNTKSDILKKYDYAYTGSLKRYGTVALLLISALVLFIISSILLHNRSHIDIDIELINKSGTETTDFYITHTTLEQNIFLKAILNNSKRSTEFSLQKVEKDTPLILYYYDSKNIRHDYILFEDLTKDSFSGTLDIEIHDKNNDGVYEFVYESR